MAKNIKLKKQLCSCLKLTLNSTCETASVSLVFANPSQHDCWHKYLIKIENILNLMEGKHAFEFYQTTLIFFFGLIKKHFKCVKGSYSKLSNNSLKQRYVSAQKLLQNLRTRKLQYKNTKESTKERGQICQCLLFHV